MVESSWGLEGVVLVIVVVFLSTFNLPLDVRPSRIDLFGSVVLGSTLHQPITRDDSASVGAVAAETAVILSWEVKESLI